MEKNKNLTYEEKNARLNEIVLQLEKGNVALDDATMLFEEASVLVKELKEVLKIQKGKITAIKQTVSEFIEEDF